VRKLYSAPATIIRPFPDIIEAFNFEGSLDGELLVGREEEGAIRRRPFGDLQQRS